MGAESSKTTLTRGQQVTANVRLLEPIGAGGMGAVWLAEHLSLKTQVVVKFMLHGAEQSKSARTRFSREAAAAALVKSPHVVQMLDHGVTDEGFPFIVMEHLTGMDLSKRLEDAGPLPVREVVAIVHQVAKALTGVHAAGLMHRDIKPENIFLCEHEGEDEAFVKLLDFGIAKEHQPEEGSASSETKTGQVVGTPFYMSPEQVTAQRELDPGTDLWALGVVVFEALTGRRPFDGPSFGALAVAIATGPIPKPSTFRPDLPPAVDAWFARACAREAGARFTSARQMSDALRACFEGGTFNLSPTSGPLGGSGPRARAITPGSGPRVAPTPSLELGATLATDEPPPLARSQPDHASAAGSGEGSAPGRGAPVRPWFAYAAASLVVLGVAGFVGARYARPEPVTPAATQPPAVACATPAAPRASEAPVPSAVASGIASVAAPASASATPSVEPPPAAVVARAPTKPTRDPVRPPPERASAPASVTAPPVASAPPAPPPAASSAKPPPRSSSGDIDLR